MTISSRKSSAASKARYLAGFKQPGAPPENQGANPKPMDLFNQFCHWYGAVMLGVTVIVAAGLFYSRFGGK